MKSFTVLVAFTTLLCTGAFISSCSDSNDPDVKVVACFTFPADVKTGMTVKLDGACSENAQSFMWDFGDGSTSTEAAPLHIFISKGTYQVTLTVSGIDSKTDTETKEVVVSDLPVVTHILGTTQDEVWYEDAVHIVYGEFDIENATVTIMPGAIVKFDSWTSSLRVAKNATLNAVGTAEKPVLFTANANTPAKGHWEGFRFEDGASNNSILKYCQFEYGGNDADAGMLYISGCEVTVENSEFTRSSSYAIHVDNDGRFKSFNNNVISDCDKEVMFMEPDNVHTIGLENIFNTDKGILIGNSPLTERDVAWKRQTCPYVTDGFEIGSAAGSTLTLTPGMTIRLNDAPIVIGGASGTGKLLAEGSVNEPIRFVSETAGSAGPRIQFLGGTLPG
ncbi:MAG: PKD domain-containing protein, partial [Chryseosolibacter sp.]